MFKFEQTAALQWICLLLYFHVLTVLNSLFSPFFFFLCISEKDKMLGSAFLGVQRIVHSATEDQEFWSLVVHFLRQGMRARGYHLFPFLIAIFSFCSASLNTYFPSASQHLSSFYELSIPQHPTTNLQKAFFTLHSNVWNSSSSYRILAPNYR